MEQKLSERNKNYLSSFSAETIKSIRNQENVSLRMQRRITHHVNKRKLLLSNSPVLQESSKWNSINLIVWLPQLQDSGLSPGYKLKLLMDVVKTSGNEIELETALTFINKVFIQNKIIDITPFFDEASQEIFIKLLFHRDSHIKVQVLDCLINLFSDNTVLIKSFCSRNIFNILIGLTRTEKNNAIIEKSIWALGNLVGEPEVDRIPLLNTNYWKDLIEFHKSGTEKFKALSTWVLSNLFKFERLSEKVNFEVLKVITSEILKASNEIVAESLWVLHYISRADSNAMDFIVNQNLLSFLLEKLLSNSIQIFTPVIKIINNLIFHSESHTKALINEGISVVLTDCFGADSIEVIKASIYSYSNLIASSKEVLLTLLHDESFEKFMTFIDSPNQEIRSTVIFGIHSATIQKEASVTLKIIHSGTLEKLLAALENADVDSITQIMNSISSIFELSLEAMTEDQWKRFLIDFENIGGLNKIGLLELSHNEEISNDAKLFIDEFFSEQIPPAPSISGEIFNFS